MSIEAMLMAAGAKGGLKVVDAFSTTLYTGNGGTQTITNGIDLANEGGLVWIKSREVTYSHYLFDTSRGADFYLHTNNTDTQDNFNDAFVSFNSDGFSLSADGGINNATPYASWAWRIAPFFHDIVEYTGDGTSGRQIAHDLGVAPGLIIVKCTSAVGEWAVYHRSLTATKYLWLQTTQAAISDSLYWNNTEPTDSAFTVGTDPSVNFNNYNYIAYLFAHDPSDSGIIQCGSYTGNGSTNGPVVNLGWQPQWLLLKNASMGGDWLLLDIERGITTGGSDAYLKPNSSQAEQTDDAIELTETGFKLETLNGDFNGSGNTFIYMAIRAPE